MGDGRWGHRRALAVELDIAVDPIHRSGKEKTQDERQHHPILEDDISGKREEVEAEVLAVHGIVLSIRYLIEEPQEYIPIADLPCGNQDAKEARDPRDEEMPRH